MIVHQPTNSRGNYNHNANFYTNKIWDYHFHKNLEVIYVIKGTVNCTVNNVLYQLNEGDFGLCLPCDIHRYEPKENTLYWALVFSEDYIRFFTRQISEKTGDGFHFRCNNTVENYIKEQIIYNENPSVLTMKSCLYAICEEYMRVIKLVEKDRKNTEVTTLIADYIHDNHTKKISLSEIAKQLGYDYNYMSRYFRQLFNMTFTDFVNIYRLETAIDFLENTDNSITTIAYESGFQSVRTFNSFFKTKIGVSPSEYRKKIYKK